MNDRVIRNHDTGDEDRATCCGLPIRCGWFCGVDAIGFYEVTIIGCDVCEVYTHRGEKRYTPEAGKPVSSSS